MNSVFVFRRDLRCEDNTGLIAALRDSDEVLPCFIFDPGQYRKEYFSDNAFEFMLECLEDLRKRLRDTGANLCLLKGRPDEVIGSLLEEGFESVYINRDYTPFSKERDEKIKKICDTKKASFNPYGDCMLNEPEEVLKKDGRPYTVYTPYMRKAKTRGVRRPLENKSRNYYGKNIHGTLKDIPWELLEERNRDLRVHGGRGAALNILSGMDGYGGYERERDIPGLDATTHLSAHIKFGTCSIREVYYSIAEKLGGDHPLIRQLYWRDFYTQVAYHNPRVFGSEFREKYSKIDWSYDKEKLKKWQAGKTGYPIVDAGMRELNRTGYMHNRVRMIVASFLAKDLHIDWRLGEKYFAEKLVDYDPCVNNGNWQWSASTGCDAQPYFRVFNPWTQQKRFDPECEYIKNWVEELSEYPAKEIHGLEKRHIEGYPERIVEHGIESREAKAAFASIR